MIFVLYQGYVKTFFFSITSIGKASDEVERNVGNSKLIHSRILNHIHAHIGTSYVFAWSYHWKDEPFLLLPGIPAQVFFISSHMRLCVLHPFTSASRAVSRVHGI